MYRSSSGHLNFILTQFECYSVLESMQQLHIRTPVYIGIGLMAVQQWSGVNAVVSTTVVRLQFSSHLLTNECNHQTFHTMALFQSSNSQAS